MPTDLQKQLRPASFRGVFFYVQPERGIELGGGRRLIVHEYPQKDIPYAQDLGRAARSLEFEAFVVGADYIEQSKLLASALEEPGPGKLIHPWLGDLTISVGAYRVRHDWGLGRAEFRIDAVEAGELVFPQATAATPAAGRAAATGLQTAATEWFAEVADFVGYGDRVISRALAAYTKVLRLLSNPAGAVLGPLGGANLLPHLNSLAGMFATPLNLGWSFAGLLNIAPKAKDGGLVGGASTAAERDAIYFAHLRNQVALASDAAIAPPPATSPIAPSAKQIAVNDAAIYAHTRLLLLSNAAGLATLSEGAVYDDILSARKALLGALDVEMGRAGSDAVYRALADARAAAYEDLTAKARRAARLLDVEVPVATPALVLAYDRYEAPGRELEIVARNRIRRPGFVSGVIKVLGP